MGYVTAQGRSRLALLLFAGLVAGGLLLFGTAGPAHGQEEEPPAGEAAPAEGEGTTEAPAADTQQTPNVVVHILKSVGIVFGLMLLLLSIALVALIVLLAMELRMGAVIPAGFVEDFTDTVNKRRFREAYEMAKEDGSFMARVLTAGMGRLQYGIDDAREAAFNMVESIKAGKDQLVSYLGTIGTIGPLIGLVTTVYGMILAFMKLSYGGNPRADQLAQDISQALAGTLLGIGLAVPAIFFHAFFRNRLTRLSLEAGNVSDDLLTQMYHNSRRPAPTPTSPPPVDAVNPAGVRTK